MRESERAPQFHVAQTATLPPMLPPFTTKPSDLVIRSREICSIVWILHPVHRSYNIAVLSGVRSFPKVVHLALDISSLEKRGKKSKGGDVKRQVNNLREAPYSRKDGDVVAAVDRMEDPDDRADLTRADDEVRRFGGESWKHRRQRCCLANVELRARRMIRIRGKIRRGS